MRANLTNTAEHEEWFGSNASTKQVSMRMRPSSKSSSAKSLLETNSVRLSNSLAMHSFLTKVTNWEFWYFCYESVAKWLFFKVNFIKHLNSLVDRKCNWINRVFNEWLRWFCFDNRIYYFLIFKAYSICKICNDQTFDHEIYKLSKRWNSITKKNFIWTEKNKNSVL